MAVSKDVFESPEMAQELIKCLKAATSAKDALRSLTRILLASFSLVTAKPGGRRTSSGQGTSLASRAQQAAAPGAAGFGTLGTATTELSDTSFVASNRTTRIKLAPVLDLRDDTEIKPIGVVVLMEHTHNEGELSQPVVETVDVAVGMKPVTLYATGKTRPAGPDHEFGLIAQPYAVRSEHTTPMAQVKSRESAQSTAVATGNLTRDQIGDELGPNKRDHWSAETHNNEAAVVDRGGKGASSCSGG